MEQSLIRRAVPVTAMSINNYLTLRPETFVHQIHTVMLVIKVGLFNKFPISTSRTKGREMIK